MCVTHPGITFCLPEKSQECHEICEQFTSDEVIDNANDRMHPGHLQAYSWWQLPCLFSVCSPYSGSIFLRNLLSLFIKQVLLVLYCLGKFACYCTASGQVLWYSNGRCTCERKISSLRQFLFVVKEDIFPATVSVCGVQKPADCLEVLWLLSRTLLNSA